MVDAELSRLLRELLFSRRTASLGTLDANGAPHVSMVPFAVEPSRPLVVVHVSALAAHTAHLRARPAVSLMVVDAEIAGQPVHALPRVTFTGVATVLEPDDPDHPGCRSAYLARFPEAEFMTRLTDFRFAAVRIQRTRQIAGFGAARDVDMPELLSVLAATGHSLDRPTDEGHPQ